MKRNGSVTIRVDLFHDFLEHFVLDFLDFEGVVVVEPLVSVEEAVGVLVRGLEFGSVSIVSSVELVVLLVVGIELVDFARSVLVHGLLELEAVLFVANILPGHAHVVSMLVDVVPLFMGPLGVDVVHGEESPNRELLCFTG